MEQLTRPERLRKVVFRVPNAGRGAFKTFDYHNMKGDKEEGQNEYYPKI